MHKGFSKEDSLLLKGCAIQVLMFHHLFLDKSRYEGFTFSFAPLTENIVVNIADMLKICVSLFSFISGYGLLLSYKKQDRSRSRTFKWTLTRLTGLLLPFLFCYIFCFAVSMFIDQRPVRTYFTGNRLEGWVFLLLDALGLHRFFSTPTIYSTWWYMSAAILFTALLPLIYNIAISGTGYLPLCVLTFAIPRLWGSGYPGGTNPTAFLLSFIIGMIAADYQLFDRLEEKLLRKKYPLVWMLIFCLVGIVLTYVFNANLKRKMFWDMEFSLIPIVWMLFFNYIIGSINFLRKPLIFLGKYSMTIFMTHTLIRGHYGRSFIYSSNHFMLIYLKLLLSSLLLAMLLDWLRKVIGYDKLTKYVLQKIDR